VDPDLVPDASFSWTVFLFFILIVLLVEIVNFIRGVLFHLHPGSGNSGSGKNYPGSGKNLFWIPEPEKPILDTGSWSLSKRHRIPDSVVKKTPDPGSWGQKDTGSRIQRFKKTPDPRS
jgi:hypothetical protein